MKKQISRAGYERLQQHLDFLIIERQEEVAQKLKEARAFGDLSENAEYEEAKNEQARLEAEIAELRVVLANSEIVDDSNISLTEVGFGSVVTIKRVNAGNADGESETYQIVGTMEADPFENKISDESPIGRALMRKRAGDVFSVDVPVGMHEYQVIEISKK
jgi:transcription elongation factor GreA